MNLGEFFHMGGYAFYVWISYVLAAVVLLGNWLLPLLYARRQRRALANALRHEDNE